MEEIGRYKTLLELPLFLGLNADDLQEIVAHTRLAFMKYHKDQTVVHRSLPAASRKTGSDNSQPRPFL